MNFSLLYELLPSLSTSPSCINFSLLFQLLPLYQFLPPLSTSPSIIFFFLYHLLLPLSSSPSSISFDFLYHLLFLSSSSVIFFFIFSGSYSAIVIFTFFHQTFLFPYSSSFTFFHIFLHSLAHSRWPLNALFHASPPVISYLPQTPHTFPLLFFPSPLDRFHQQAVGVGRLVELADCWESGHARHLRGAGSRRQSRCGAQRCHQRHPRAPTSRRPHHFRYGFCLLKGLWNGVTWWLTLLNFAVFPFFLFLRLSMSVGHWTVDRCFCSSCNGRPHPLSLSAWWFKSWICQEIWQICWKTVYTIAKSRERDCSSLCCGVLLYSF